MALPEPKPTPRPLRIALVFALLAAFWLIFSGKFDAFHLALGAISCGIVAVASGDLLRLRGDAGAIRIAWRFALYLPWLLWQIWLSSLHVLRLTLDPRDIQPRMVRIDTGLHSELARVTLANSITLTPGTLTVDVDGPVMVVHGLSQAALEDIEGGEMARRVARIFGEPGPRGAQ